MYNLLKIKKKQKKTTNSLQNAKKCQKCKLETIATERPRITFRNENTISIYTYIYDFFVLKIIASAASIAKTNCLPIGISFR